MHCELSLDRLSETVLMRDCRKNYKNWDTIMITVFVVNVEQYGFILPECT